MRKIIFYVIRNIGTLFLMLMCVTGITMSIAYPSKFSPYFFCFGLSLGILSVYIMFIKYNSYKEVNEENSTETDIVIQHKKATKQKTNKPKIKINANIVFLTIIFFGIITFSLLLRNDMIENPRKYTRSITFKNINDISEEDAEKIDDILDNCGIDNIEKFEHDISLDNRHSKGEKGYRIDMKDTSGHAFLYIKKNNEVHSVAYKNYILYKKNKQLYTMKDFTFTSSEKADWSLYCEDEVKKVLRSPSTADFASTYDWYFGKTDKEIIIKGYVDSQNGFGAEVRSTFVFIINKETNTVTSFTMNGNEML